MEALAIDAARAAWVQETYITDDTQLIAAAANEKVIAEGVRLAKEAARFDGLPVDPAIRRKLDLLKLGLTSPAPSDPAKTAELTRLAARLESTYGAAKYCRKNNDCLDVQQIGTIMATSRDPKQLLDVWTGWHATARPMRSDYARFAQLMNEGSHELGFKDTGAMWRSNYDMPPEQFAAETDRLWNQVKPLYDALHCHVRAKLLDKYGSQIVPAHGPIPAHLLGNIWAQDWSNIYDLVAPPSTPTYDLTEILKQKKIGKLDMVRAGERFFKSLGFAPLPETFWTRSMLIQPRDRDVVCHASAEDVDGKDDIRIKMCIEQTAEDLKVIHHELGHNMYQRAYKNQPFLFKNSANDGFHEAIGDTIALSITPPYLKQIGLIQTEPPASADLGLLMRDALDKVAFLPFGIVVDQWRWNVFSGEIAPADYNKAWWQLREKYQGVAAPAARDENDFDPGAKYHIPGNTPYARYFLADILQFQFHRALCNIAGQKGPLNRCTIYGNKEAGARLASMLEMGQSKPWPDAMEALTGTRTMDATALVDYFAPLKQWLDKENAGRACGW